MTDREGVWKDRVQAARRLIEERLDEDVPLEELASAAHYSLFHFHRLFRALTGETVRQYARRLRLERAAYRLTHGDDDVLGIALDAGFESHEAFTRAFKGRFGEPPSTFRTQKREAHSARSTAGKEQDMDIRIERRAPARIAYVRHVGPYEDVDTAWKQLMKWGWSKMMFGKAETFGLCYDDPDVTPAKRVRYDACMVVDHKTKPKGPVEIRDMEQGTYAVAVHEGGFDTIGDTYAELFAQISSDPTDGRRWTLGDPPSLEKYLSDPRKVKPEDMRTEIWMPVG